ncbi:MAG: agmatinase [Archaeoglobaceae archaeon]
MHIDSHFSCSNSILEEADFVIFGIPYDASQSFKSGSRFAPNAIREASWNLEEYSLYFDFDLDDVNICDAGNVNCDGDFYSIMERVAHLVDKLEPHTNTIAMGGEHTISYACTPSVPCYVVFDAHLDLRNEFDGSIYNHACTSRRIYEKLEAGEIDNLVQVGVRSGTAEERGFAEKNGIDVYYSWEVINNGIGWVIKQLQQFDDIYLSIDMDVFDPAFAPGVATPEPFGIHPIHLLRFIDDLSDLISGIDVVEVIPDSNKVTQMLAAKIITEYIAARSSPI